MGIANQNLLPSEQAIIAGGIDPASYNAGTVTSGWISMATFAAIQALILAGTLGANATLDAKIQQAQDAAGTGAKDIAGKAITQMTQAGTNQSDTQAVINVTEADLDVANNFTHVRLSMTVAVAASDAGAVIMGHLPHYGPASDHAATTVGEIVV